MTPPPAPAARRGLAPLGLWSEEGQTKTGAYLFSVCRDDVGPGDSLWLDVAYSDDRNHECVLEVRGKTEEEALDRAKEIVRAVNNHAALLAALDSCLGAIWELHDWKSREQYEADPSVIAARTAIRAARGEG